MARWVCRRCFEANDEAVAACGSCGLPRGAEPPAGEGLAPAVPASPGGGGRTILSLVLRFWWVLAIVAVGVGGYLFNAQRGDDGTISRSGTLAITELRVGDCFDLNDESVTEVDEVSARPCGEPHEFEMFHVGSYSGAVGSDAFPGSAAFEDYVGEHCLAAFGAFVGMAYEQSRLDISWFEPTSDSWSQGDRVIQCAVVDPAVPKLTESLRNAAR